MSPWFRAFTEGALIVGSILLAFALDAWWDNRSREGDLRVQLEVVADELRSTRDMLTMVLRAHDLNARLLRDLRVALSEVEAGTEVAVADETVGPLMLQVTADVTTSSLDAFIAAGGLELVDDRGLRAELRAWPAYIEDLLDDEIYLRNFAAADLGRWLREHVDTANAELQGSNVVMHRLGGAPPPAPELLGTLTLRRDRELMNLLAARESGERMIRANLERLVEQAERNIAALGASR